MTSFASECSMHGINFIFNHSKSKLSRLFWTFALICSFCGFCYYIHGAFIKLRLYPDVVLKITQRPMNELPFPAITLCTPVFAKRELIDFRYFQNSSFPWIDNQPSDNECKYLIANEHFCQNPALGLIIPRCKNNSIADIVQVLSESSLKAAELISNKASSPRFAESVSSTRSPLHKYDKVLANQGFCFTSNLQNHDVIFNEAISDDFDSYKREMASNGVKHWTLERGFFTDETTTFPARITPKNHALIQLQLNKSEITNYCKNKQFSIILHLPNEVPTPFHESYPFEFGRNIKYQLSAVNYRSDEALRAFNPLRRNCYFDDERKLKFFKTYTKPHCDYECMANYTLNSCGCVKFSMPRDSQTRVCDLIEATCFNTAMENWSNNSKTINSDKPCDCLSTCTNIKYAMKIKADVALPLDVTKKFIGIAQIHTYDYVADVHETIVNYNIQSFIADIGGLLGLFMGCSLLSIIELFYFGIGSFFYKKKRRSGSHKTKFNRSNDKNNQKLNTRVCALRKQVRFLLRNRSKIDTE